MSELIRELYRMVFITSNILIRNNVWYSADGGTLLGAVRHHGIIPWDNDADFMVLTSDYRKILALKPEFEKYGYRLVNGREGWWKVKKTGTKASLDLFPIYIRTQGREIITDYDIPLADWTKCHHKLTDLLPMKKYKFGKGHVLGPANPKPYLDKCYGKSWKTVGYMTQDFETHYELDEPIKVEVTKFVPAEPQLSLKQVNVCTDYLNGHTDGWCETGKTFL